MVRLALERWGRYLSCWVLWVIVDRCGSPPERWHGPTIPRTTGKVRLDHHLAAQVFDLLYYIVEIASELNIIPDTRSRCYEIDTTVAAKYEDIFNTRLVAWQWEHVIWQFCQPWVLQPEADCL